jgi:SAM-dependent methyltransferase
VTAVDASLPIVRRARARERKRPLGVEYCVADAAHLDGLPDDAFDLVVCNMALMDIEDARGAIHEVTRALRPGGRFGASLSHPCFNNGSASAWSIERVGLETTVYRKISRSRECFDELYSWRTEHGPGLFTRGFHRPLSWYASVLRNAGLVITGLEEPEPTKEMLRKSTEGPWIASRCIS